MYHRRKFLYRLKARPDLRPPRSTFDFTRVKMTTNESGGDGIVQEPPGTANFGLRPTVNASSSGSFFCSSALRSLTCSHGHKHVKHKHDRAYLWRTMAKKRHQIGEADVNVTQ